MKRKDFMDKLRSAHILELKTIIRDLEEELFSLRFQISTGHLEDYSRLNQVKKQIARARTVLRARELGFEKEMV